MIVPLVDHQEPVLQTVNAQMVSSITETPVLLVLITVLLVTTETNVSPVKKEESVPNVLAQMVSTILVKNNVPLVKTLVPNVTETTDVPPVKEK
jgi:hypothetical protein